MAMPHIIQMRLIKERLKGKEGKAKLREIEEIQSELPGFNNGPYGEIKKWLFEEIEKTKTRSKVKHQDWLSIKKQGIKQFALVGCPNVGKSSLVNKLSGLQTKIANYEFTTLRPIPGVVSINDAAFQIIDLPGLVEGAVDDAGGGRRLIGIVKGCDGVILMHDLTKPLADVEKMVAELEKAKVNKPLIVVGSKADMNGTTDTFNALKKRFSERMVIKISTITGLGIIDLRDSLWNISNLIRVQSKGKEHFMILDKGATVRDFVEHIHKDFLNKFRFARISGPSAKFSNQQIGLEHILEDGDIVDVVLER